MPGSGLARKLLAVALLIGSVASTLLVSPVASGPAHAAYNRTVRVTKVLDGDTVEVDTNNDGQRDATVRLQGIDTPEKGQCGFRAATDVTRSLLDGRRVTLSTDVAGAIASDGWRWLRRVSVVRAGVRKDATAQLLARGLGFWMPNHDQHTNEGWYRRNAANAAAARRGIYAGSRCGSGPYERGRLHIDVQWRGSEHVRITNRGPGTANVTGWTIRSGSIRRFRVPAVSGYSSLPAGRTLRIYVGRGQNTRYQRYLQYGGLIWRDIDVWKQGSPYGSGGEGGYVVDPHGDVRAHQIYGCAALCADPSGARIQVTAVSKEHIRVTNVSDRRTRVGRFLLQVGSHEKLLPPMLTLAPRESFIVWSTSGSDSRNNYYMSGGYGSFGKRGGDRVMLRSYNGIRVDCVELGRDYAACQPLWHRG